MPKYHVHVKVVRARGRQTWAIEAKNKKAAIDAWNDGDGDCIHEELEADESEIISVEKVAN